ncbi:uncharacterized protein PHACADRAFT_195909 [Phanerochaete carnosa HHB-10118-sp]|uniref:Cytochrome P450 n=1 Tax=Phanerochaete carnosa (strain HHB-10118-sp) TaxID=650164 RepID=K5VWE4_PHACS|nr:uncharacterized protein PHACADRAFT_195909 [Phanerochaete carnosa HHB-10118-sp]EKM55858.1 hypothetical protein PHACADRAFT_195909 [Phanerochaete carnosa HHB-10118-sp]
MLHNEDIFSDPDTFKPERFLSADGSLCSNVPYPIKVFGFGRQICPGRHFAHDIVWLIIAQGLAAFKIEHTINVNGKEIEPKGEFTPRLLIMPEPFKCQFTLWFPEVKTLIHSSAQ